MHRSHIVRSTVISGLILCATLFAQSTSSEARADGFIVDGGAKPDEVSENQLQHFDPKLVDESLSPCDDFYKYACSKWQRANPIPPDQVFWGTVGGLVFWNDNLLREILEAASADDLHRNAARQKIGDYWAACMDERGIEAAGPKP